MEQTLQTLGHMLPKLQALVNSTDSSRKGEYLLAQVDGKHGGFAHALSCAGISFT